MGTEPFSWLCRFERPLREGLRPPQTLAFLAKTGENRSEKGPTGPPMGHFRALRGTGCESRKSFYANGMSLFSMPQNVPKGPKFRNLDP